MVSLFENYLGLLSMTVTLLHHKIFHPIIQFMAQCTMQTSCKNSIAMMILPEWRPTTKTLLGKLTGSKLIKANMISEKHSSTVIFHPANGCLESKTGAIAISIATITTQSLLRTLPATQRKPWNTLNLLFSLR